MKSKKHFNVTMEQDEDDVYIAICTDMQGCHSFGYTIEEAVKNIKDAIWLCLQSRRDVKEPTHSIFSFEEIQVNVKVKSSKTS